MPNRRLNAAAIHTSHLLLLLWGYYSIRNSLSEPKYCEQSGGSFQYLTIQGLFLSIHTTVVCIVADLGPRLNGLFVLRRLLVRTSLQFSATVFVIYCYLRWRDPTAIARGLSVGEIDKATTPEALDVLLGPTDFVIHLWPFIAHILHLYTLEASYDRSPVGFPHILGTMYWILSEWCVLQNPSVSYSMLGFAFFRRLLWSQGAIRMAIVITNRLNDWHPTGLPAIPGVYSDLASGFAPPDRHIQEELLYLQGFYVPDDGEESSSSC